jgi:hypothetical protein
MFTFFRSKKQAKVQWVQDPSQSNLDNLNNARRETSRHFRNQKSEYLKAKINDLETNSKNMNIRELYKGINDFKKSYQPRNNIVKDEKRDLVADSHSSMARWRNYFCQLLNVLGDNNVRPTEIHTPQPLVPEPVLLRSRWLLESLKATNRLVLIIFQQN